MELVYEMPHSLYSMESLACSTSILTGVQSDLMTKIWFHMLHHTVSTSNTGKHGIYYLIK